MVGRSECRGWSGSRGPEPGPVRGNEFGAPNACCPVEQTVPMTSHVLVLGEALVDLIVTEDAAVPHIGGGPLNTARALARLGVPTAFVGGVSSDVFGKRITAAMVADGVGIDTVVKTEAPTTMALVELNAAGAASYRFYFEGTSVAACTTERATSSIDALLATSEDVCAVHVGTLGLVIEPAATASEAIVNRFAEGSALVMIDPNIRQVVLGDIRDVYLERLYRVLPKADIVKVSDEDLAWIAPGVDLVAAAQEMVAKGSGVVLVTRGGDGITIVCAEGVVDVPAPRAEVVDTVGAGDTFAAGVLSWWIDNNRPSMRNLANLVAATERGAAAAAIVVARAGANPPTRAELGL
jgi:fructokinase